MASARYHNVVTTSEYAKLHGISMRTARRQLASNPNAVKTGRGYKIAIPSTTYARLAGISAKSARKTATKVSEPTQLIVAAMSPTSKTALYRHLFFLADHGASSPSEKQIHSNIDRMTAKQRREASKLSSYDEYVDAMLNGDEYLDDDNDNLLWYKG